MLAISDGRFLELATEQTHKQARFLKKNYKPRTDFVRNNNREMTGGINCILNALNECFQ